MGMTLESWKVKKGIYGQFFLNKITITSTIYWSYASKWLCSVFYAVPHYLCKNPYGIGCWGLISVADVRCTEQGQDSNSKASGRPLPSPGQPNSGGNFHLVVLLVLDAMVKKAIDLPMATMLGVATPLQEGYQKYLLPDYPPRKKECWKLGRLHDRNHSKPRKGSGRIHKRERVSL